MKWIILISGILLTSVCLTSAQQGYAYYTLSGTCASIGYSNSCCPLSLGDECQAADGECRCDTNCHVYQDCCEDVHCPAEPRTCADVGITSCCSDETDNEYCDVHFRDEDNNRCSCNVSCHLRNDCCSDATDIGCVPQTCTEAGKDPGCCIFSQTHSCFVEIGGGGRGCYCDSFCTVFDDCCKDVDTSVAQQCTNSQLARSRIQSQRVHTMRGTTTRRYYDKGRRTGIQNAKSPANFRDALASRVPRPQRVNKNQFRARLTAGRGRRPVG